MKYIIDACSLIDASKNYNMKKKSFSMIWKTLDMLVENGRLISSIEVLEELKDDDISKWGKERRELFLPLTQEIQMKTKEILVRHPDMIKITTKGNSNADPFLIATAFIEKGTLVTEEKHKIPKICTEENVPFTDLAGFLNKVLE